MSSKWFALLLCVTLGAFAIIKRKTLAAKCSKQERDDSTLHEQLTTP